MFFRFGGWREVFGLGRGCWDFLGSGWFFVFEFIFFFISLFRVWYVLVRSCGWSSVGSSGCARCRLSTDIFVRSWSRFRVG